MTRPQTITPRRTVRADFTALPPERWGRELLTLAAIPGPATVSLMIPPGALVPMELDELRRVHGAHVAIVADDWPTGDRWRAALREGVAPWLGMPA